MSSYYNSQFKWYSARWIQYHSDRPASLGTCDILAMSKAKATRIMTHDVLSEEIYSDLNLTYMGTWKQYQSLHGTDGELLMPDEPIG